MKSTSQFKKLPGILLGCFLFFLLCAGLSTATPAHAAISTTATTLAATSTPSLRDTKIVSGGKFMKKTKGYVYRYKNGTLAKNCFLKISGKIYYFAPSGYRNYGWQKIGSNYFYFGKVNAGYMYRNCWLRGKLYRYRVGANGRRLHSTWFTQNGNTYYFLSNGRMCTGERAIDGVTYYFSSTGKMQNTDVKLSISSDTAILINASTGAMIYGKNQNATHANASTTKILTCILALENSGLNNKVKFSANAAAQEPTHLNVKAGDTFYMKDLLYSLMIPSHNDTAVAIAEHISGSTAKFVALMNAKAKEIGCTNTHFVTPNGLDSGLNHYTTASDLSKIATYAYKNLIFRTIVSTPKYSFYRISPSRKLYTVTTTNELLGNLNGLCGIKTGYTKKAGHCFVGVIKSKSGTPYISVVLGGATSDARWKDTQTLLNYVYNR